MLKLSKKIFFLIILAPALLFSQNFETERTKSIIIKKLEFRIDSFSIISNTLSIKYKNRNQFVTKNSYNLNEIESIIQIKDTLLIGDTLLFNYSVFPVLLSKTFYNRKLKFIEPTINNSYLNRNRNEIDKKNKSQLIRSGNISRNIVIGNNQDLSVISNIDLRINGKLNDDINIQAVISDNNLPFQADGTSYKLQEFDKVFIKIYNKKNKIIVGDIITKRKSRFLNYNRKSKGILINNNKNYNSYRYSNLSNISMSKGKYTTQSFYGNEGDQGPYKLKGKNGENYVVVLSGTERVFMNGKRLDRGINKDYIIDYNTAEITFTSQHLITKDHRFYVEFEYDDRSYAQSVITSTQNFKNKNFEINIDLYSELDWKNQNYQTDLSDSDKQLLSNLDNGENNIYLPSIDTTSYSEDKILYQKKDTIISGISLQFYKHSYNPDSAIYQIKFTEVNQNEGNYILDEEGVNGKIYLWIPPIFSNGIFMPQGNFSPVIRVITPKSKTIISTEILSRISKKIDLNLNFTLENFDRNLFSDCGHSDNNSAAKFIELEYNLIDTDKLKIINKNSFEHISNGYSGINKFKDVEFNRYWNLNNLSGDQTLLQNEISITNDSLEVLKYIYQSLRIRDLYTGYRNSLKLDFKRRRYMLFTESKLSKTQSTESNSTILLTNSQINYMFKYINLNLSLQSEKFQNKNQNNEFLTSSNSFIEAISSISDKNKLLFLEFRKRTDKRISKFSNSNQINLNYKYDRLNNFKYNTGIKYRDVMYTPDTLFDESNLLTSNDIKIIFLKEFIQLNYKYELGQGKQAKKEKSFIKVPTGLGTHTWIDNNNNGVKELNEFATAIFQDEAEYVVLLLPSTSSENIYFMNYNQNISFDFKRVTKNNFLKKIYIQNLYQVENKNRYFNYNPFDNNISDNSVDYKSHNINSLSFNRNNKFLNLNFQNKRSIAQNTYSYGTDIQKNIENQLILNNLIINNINNKTQVTIGRKNKNSDFFNNQNYQYSYNKLEQELQIKMKNNNDITLAYTVQNKKTYENVSEVKSNMISCIFKKINNTNFIFETYLKYIDIIAVLNNNSVLNYELLEGFNEGKNIVWGINFQKKLKNSLHIDLIYDGRVSEKSNIKHVGNIGVTAFF